MLASAAILALFALFAAPVAPGAEAAPIRDAAWASALPPGEVHLPAGFYRGPWSLGPGVHLIGEKGAILEGGDPVLRLSGGDRVERLELRAAPGGVGVAAQDAGGVELDDLEINGGARGARIQGGSLRWRGGVIERQSAYGIWLQGCQAALEHLTVRHQLGPAIFAGHVDLVLRESELADAEYGLLSEAGRAAIAKLGLERISRAGFGLVHTDAQIGESRLEGPFSEAALSINDARSLELSGLTIRRAGTAGIKLLGSRARLRGNLIEGTRTDADGLEGDGLYAYNSEVDSEGDALLDDAGAAISISGGRARIAHCRIEKAGRAAAAVAAHGELTLRDCALGEGSRDLIAESGSKLVRDPPP